MKILDLSIIIVNWNSKDFLRKCLVSIETEAGSLAYEVIVIDNASYDGSEQMVTSEFPLVQFIQSKENLGFSKANNLAFSQSRGRNILFLNPDTEVQRNALQELIRVLETTPKAGFVGAKLLNSDYSLQTTCITAIPSIINQALAFNLLRRYFPRLQIWGMQPLYTVSPNISTVEAISGACMMCKRFVLDEIGGFTIDYFMYSEDMDLCIKVKKAGFLIYYAPEATVVHHGGKSSSMHLQSNFSSVMKCESLAKFFARHHGTWYSRSYRISTAIVAMGRVLFLVAAFPATLILKGYTSWSRIVSKWSAILLWSLDFSRW